MPRPIQATIHLQALRQNLAQCRAAAPDAKVWAVVKTNAYGHVIERVFDGRRGADGIDWLQLHEGERALQEWPDLPWTILRPPALYGPGDVEMRPILALLRRGLAPITGPRHQRISLLHVDDFATAVLAWLGNPGACRQRCFELHDGTAGGYDWPSLGRAVAAREVRLLPVPSIALRTAATVNWLLSFALRYAPMLTPGKARELVQETWVADNDAFRAATGWSPAIRLAEGAARLFEASTRD